MWRLVICDLIFSTQNQSGENRCLFSTQSWPLCQGKWMFLFFFLFQYLKLVFQSGRSGYFDIELALHISVWGPHLILFLMLLAWSLQPLPTFLYCKVDGKLGNCEAAILWSTACGGWFWSDFQANGSYIKRQSYPINTLTTNDASWRRQFLATCNQLAQFILKIGSAPAETVGQGKVHLSAFLHKRA